MTTTVQISDETRRLLERLKNDLGLSTYDDVIRTLVKKRTGIPESLFGACKGSRPFVREREPEHVL